MIGTTFLGEYEEQKYLDAEESIKRMRKYLKNKSNQQNSLFGSDSNLD